MSDLLSDVLRRGTSLGRPGPGAHPSHGRPLVQATALAALAAAGIGAGLCMALALIGWFLADAGSHGSTVDALRVGADAWLTAQGARVTAGGVPLGMLPLGLTAGVAVVLFRCGRWAGGSAEANLDERTLGKALGVFALIYAVTVTVIGVVVTTNAADPNLPRALFFSLVLAALAGGLGLTQETGHLRSAYGLVPGFVRSMIEGAVLATGLVVAAAALLVTTSLLLSFNDASSLMGSLRLGVGDALMLTLLTALYAPNAVLLGISWLLGPGFAVGTGTLVSPTAVHLGALPAVPALAALPAGSPAAWLAVLMAVPPMLAAVGAAMAQRRYAVLAWDSTALRGFGTGVGSAVLLVVLVALAGGPMGTGRLADIGASAGEVFVVAIGGMSLGGLLGALAMCTWQRLRA